MAAPTVHPAMARRSGLAGDETRGFAPDGANPSRWRTVPPRTDAEADSEARLVERLVAREERAFNALVCAYERRVFGVLLRMMGSQAEAEDLSQEVFVQVFKAIGTFRGESKLSTWIYRIAINLCKNRSKYLRIRQAASQTEIEAAEEHGAMKEPKGNASAPMARPDDALVGKELERIVQGAILELEPSFRECLILRDIEDLAYDEIETITGLPEGTVKSRIHRARAQLRQIVERELGEKVT